MGRGQTAALGSAKTAKLLAKNVQGLPQHVQAVQIRIFSLVLFAQTLALLGHLVISPTDYVRLVPFPVEVVHRQQIHAQAVSIRIF